MNYLQFRENFSLYHEEHLTIIVHFVTSITMYNYILQWFYGYSNMLLLLYSLLLWMHNTHLRLILSTSSILYLSSYCVSYISLKYAIICIVLQYLSHIISGEITYISTYFNTDDRVETYMNHFLLTIPCVFDLFESIILYPKNNIYFGKINEDEYRDNILTWIYNNVNTEDQTKTTHWWYTNISNELKKSYDVLNSKVMKMIKNKFSKMNVIQIDEMNEIYVSSNTNHIYNSDNVFYSKHIDGPYYLFPFCSVYRTILSLNENQNITTIFPTINKNYTLTNGEFVSFDFNRDIHYISSKNKVADKPRVTLKLHYLIYPKYMYPLAMILYKLNVMYDRHARELFLYTLSPSTKQQKMSSIFVNVITNLTYIIENYVGILNITLLVFIILLNI